MVQVASEPFGGTDLKPESSGNTQALNIAEDQHFLSVCPYASTTPSDYCSFIASFEIRKCDLANFVSLSRLFEFSESLDFHMNFRIILSISAQKKPAGILLS